ncbi:DUF3667 domain-containing protein [Zeaxanthinibacter enoshimensis]|uniref:DUF3667 domain-containing protein n=1 Tax=Zeaxanthinibacter enoshimensis TaxID=392009 RepID=UPI001FB5CCF0|nr:DUF3667 domain-containing protein [Zeaxanthinibacter enoshimensis]
MNFKNLWQDIAERYFNLDNSITLTFIHLITQPEVVISGYIGGLRKKYLNPISYLGIALTLAGLLLFLLQKFFQDQMSYDIFNSGVREETMNKMMDVVMDISSFVFLLYIPVFSIAGRLTFNKKDYVLTEHIITFLYIMAQWSILSFPVSLAILIFSPDTYMKMGIPMMLTMLIYSFYVQQRIHRYSTTAFVGRGLLFSLLAFMGYIGLIMLMMVFFFASGILSLSDFRPA